MATASFNYVPNHRDRLRGTVLLSIILHISLFLAAFVYTTWGHQLGNPWAKGGGTGGSAIHVNAVSALPGIPLPAPEVSAPATLATPDLGLYKPETKLPPPPPPDAVQIPKFKEAEKIEKPVRVNKRIQKEDFTPPDNAIPSTEGGKPQMTYGGQEFANSAGSGGLNLGDFGDRFSWYVNAVRARVSSNWLLTMVSSSISSAPRVYITFDILRDGEVTNVEVTQSSGIPEVDRSALRAVLASNPLGPLPPDYQGKQVTVKIYFDFHR
jgi:TonB family protein